MLDEYEKKDLDRIIKKLKSKKKYTNDSSLTGKRRIFNKDMHEKYDIPARDLIIKKLGSDFVMENPDIYEQDLIITCDRCKYKFIELQVLTRWIGKEFPYDFSFLYERKKKYDNDTLFITLSGDYKYFHLFDRKSIIDNKPITPYKYSREKALIVPWNKIISNHIDCLDKLVILAY